MSKENQELSRIVVIDDDDSMGQFLSALLTHSFDAQVHTFQDPKEALGLLRAAMAADGTIPIDTIVCDFNMPTMSGHDFLVEVRSLGLEVPIVFLSSFLDQKTILEALRLGAFDVVAKPPVPATLVRIVQLAIRVGERKRSIARALGELRNVIASSELPTEKIAAIKQSLDEIQEARKAIALLMLRNYAHRSGS